MMNSISNRVIRVHHTINKLDKTAILVDTLFDIMIRRCIACYLRLQSHCSSGFSAGGGGSCPHCPLATALMQIRD